MTVKYCQSKSPPPHFDRVNMCNLAVNLGADDMNGFSGISFSMGSVAWAGPVLMSHNVYKKHAWISISGLAQARVIGPLTA